MSKTKFTLGQASIETTDAGDAGLYLDFYDKNESLIAEICLYEDEDENKANAALIVAAPEMYEHLYFLLNTIKKRFPERGAIIEKLLRKARGESEVDK